MWICLDSAKIVTLSLLKGALCRQRERCHVRERRLFPFTNNGSSLAKSKEIMLSTDLQDNFFIALFSFCLVDRRNGQCSKIREPKFCPDDLHYNLTFVVENEQTSDSILQTILDSKCSPDLEKYLCYTTVPPCKTNDLSVYVPCRSVCEQVCWLEF